MTPLVSPAVIKGAVCYFFGVGALAWGLISGIVWFAGAFVGIGGGPVLWMAVGSIAVGTMFQTFAERHFTDAMTTSGRADAPRARPTGD